MLEKLAKGPTPHSKLPPPVSQSTDTLIDVPAGGDAGAAAGVVATNNKTPAAVSEVDGIAKPATSDKTAKPDERKGDAKKAKRLSAAEQDAEAYKGIMRQASLGGANSGKDRSKEEKGKKAGKGRDIKEVAEAQAQSDAMEAELRKLGAL